MVRYLAVGLFLLLFTAAAHAADEPVIGQAPAPWVIAADVESEPTGQSTAAIRFLLQDTQLHFGADGDSTYNRSVLKIQTPQGLAGAGTVGLNWNPDTETLVVHRLVIRRGGETIDVLAKQKFAILRRENNLEYAMLDGILTATLQPEGLRVGDIIDLSTTVIRRDPTMKGYSNFVALDSGAIAIDHLRMRATWPDSKQIRWRKSASLSDPRISRLGAETELLVDLRDVQPLHPPKGAPARFATGRRVEISDFKSWADVSSLFSPLYDKASTLKSDSPLKAEVAKIRASSKDPVKQVEAALALVQNQTRYVFLGMNLGGLQPAGADDTWVRRFGDCKAKTALLLALLKELGVKARPAVVSTYQGDGLDERLPAAGLFDHILVRAEIGGQVYWLDGTRTGDTSLDRLRVPPFKWALPIEKSGATLERLSPKQLETPDIVASLVLDATAGLDAKAPAHAEATTRGDAAVLAHMSLANLSAADLERTLRQFWSATHDAIDAKAVSESYDPSTGVQTFKMDGLATLDWDNGGSRPAYEIEGAALGWKSDFDRDPAEQQDAPFAVEYPFFTQATTTIKLPAGGRGFSIQGADVDKTVAGIQFHRRTRIEGDVLTMNATMRTEAEEFPASQSSEAGKALRDMAKVRVFLIAPAPDAAAALANPKTAGDFVNRGYSRMKAQQLDDAIADFTRAIELDPNNTTAYADRGISYLRKGSIDRARSDLDAGKAINSNDSLVYQGLGSLAERERKWTEAIAFYSQALERNPDDMFSLEARTRDEAKLEQYDAALKDCDELLRRSPDSKVARAVRTTIFLGQGAFDKALAEMNLVMAATPNAAENYWSRGEVYTRMGKVDEAQKDYDTAVTLEPSPNAFIHRALLRTPKEIDRKREDFASALKLDPKSVRAYAEASQIEVEAGDYAKALAILNTGIKSTDNVPDLLLARATVELKANKRKDALSDFDLVRKRGATDAAILNNLCWQEAIANVELETALADCNASLALAPADGLAKDSRAFVELRLGRFDEAIADYDAALETIPGQPASLYGRGIAKLRKGMNAKGQEDLAAARKNAPEVEAVFDGYGVRP